LCALKNNIVCLWVKQARLPKNLSAEGFSC
jgi:hypothetical protein